MLPLLQFDRVVHESIETQQSVILKTQIIECEEILSQI